MQFVNHFRAILFKEYFKAQGIPLEFLHEWTDGAACQYKCAKAFADIAACSTNQALPLLGKAINIQRNFFATSHAKGPQDAAGGRVKTRAREACLVDSPGNKWFNEISNARKLFEYCKAELQDFKFTTQKKAAELQKPKKTYKKSAAQIAKRRVLEKCDGRFFYWIPLQKSPDTKEEVAAGEYVERDDIKWETVNRTQRLHSVASYCSKSLVNVQVRDYSCYCWHCLHYPNQTKNFPCQGPKVVDSWRHITLQTTDRDLQDELDAQAIEAVLQNNVCIVENSVFAVLVSNVEPDEDCFALFCADQDPDTLTEGLKVAYTAGDNYQSTPQYFAVGETVVYATALVVPVCTIRQPDVYKRSDCAKVFPLSAIRCRVEVEAIDENGHRRFVLREDQRALITNLVLYEL